MRVALLAIALTLIAASVGAFILSGPDAGSEIERGHRALVEGRVTGDFEDHPWVGTLVHVGSDYQTLAEDGRFRFAVLPGHYILTVCCSPRFQSIYRELPVAREDIQLDLVVKALTEIPGQLVRVSRAKIPEEIEVVAKMPGTNVVDRAVPDFEGRFALHLTEGEWVIGLENLPEGQTLAAIAAGPDPLEEFVIQVGGSEPSRLPLQITLR